MTLPCPYGSAGRFRPCPPPLAPPLVARPGFGAPLDVVTSPLLGDGVLYLVDRVRGLVCMDAATAEQRWAHPAERGEGECLLAGDRIVTTPAPGRVEQLAAATGAVIDTAAEDGGLLLRSAVLDAGRVVGPLVNGTLAAWDLARHAFAWRGPLVRADVPVAFADGTLVAVGTHALVGHSLADGAQRWRLDLRERGRRTVLGEPEDGQVAGRPLAHDGLAWCAVTGGGVLAVGLDDGQVRWHVPVGWTIGVSVELIASDTLVVLADDALVTLDARTGAVRRRSPLHGDVPMQPPFTPMALSAGYAWAVDRQGRLVAARLDDGVVAFHAEVGGFVHEPPVVGVSALYVATFEGRLAAFAAALAGG